jgi:trk system potassium uptake protein TrkH
VGLVTLSLSAGMLLCAAWGMVMEFLGAGRGLIDQAAWIPMIFSAAVTLSAGLVFLRLSEGEPHPSQRTKSALLSVALIWGSCSIFGALPFLFDAHLSPIDALFETVSGFTTTGSSIITDIEGTISQPLLLWRSLIQWLGGMGIVVLFVAVFPTVGVGAKQMFRNEVPGPSSEGLRPRIAETSLALWKLYSAFTLVLWAILLFGFKMDPLTAICHAFTTISTAGFSTMNDSIGAWNDPMLEFTLSIFMLISGVNFALYFNAMRHRSLRGFWKSTEFRVYMATIVGATTLLTLANLGLHQGLFLSLRHSFFTVAATITSTGFSTHDYMAYSQPALFIFILLMFVGASAGSTSGGIKIARIAMMAKLGWSTVRHTLRPNLIQTIRMGGKAVPVDVLNGVGAFMIIYFISITGGTLVLTLTDPISVQNAFGAALTSLSNMGPTPWHAGADNFAAFSAAGKLTSSTLMILGRLEFFALLVLLHPDFWRR